MLHSFGICFPSATEAPKKPKAPKLKKEDESDDSSVDSEAPASSQEMDSPRRPAAPTAKAHKAKAKAYGMRKKSAALPKSESSSTSDSEVMRLLADKAPEKKSTNVEKKGMGSKLRAALAKRKRRSTAAPQQPAAAPETTEAQQPGPKTPPVRGGTTPSKSSWTIEVVKMGASQSSVDDDPLLAELEHGKAPDPPSD